MKISIKLLESFGIDLSDFKKEPQKLAQLLTDNGLEVEEIQDQANQFKNVVIGQIAEKTKYPQADQLTLCTVNTGDRIRRIVCGAKNHNAGDKVVVALPGAVLPGNFAIRVSKIRGEESEGMLCSEKELGLKSESEGILILPQDVSVGIPFSQFAKLDDVILDIKVTPNRADCLSHYGVVREISALTGKTFSPLTARFQEGRESTKKLVKVVVEDFERAPRYTGRLVKDVKVKESPEWLKKALESLGLRSINNIVDITNYILMAYGQPLHAFDFSKINGAALSVRAAKDGEKLVTLDNQELNLKGSELVIADANGPVALAGVMGGLDSGVTEKTKDIFIEAAVFNPASVRRTSKLHGLATDSSYRFSRGVDPEGVLFALNKACQMVEELAQGSVCADFYDSYPRPLSRARIEVDLKFISARLGISVEATEAKKILEKLGCVVSGGGDKLLVNPPTYRGDLRLPEDIGEEILRFKGFSAIPETIPPATIAPTKHQKGYALEQKLVMQLTNMGISQAVNLSLVNPQFEQNIFGAPESLSKKELGFDLSLPTIRVQNPLNLELESMRRALFPSLIKNMIHNYSRAVGYGHLFETAPTFYSREQKDILDQVRPFDEELHLALCLWGNSKTSWLGKNDTPIFYKVKGVLEKLFDSWSYKAVGYQSFKTAPSFLHPGQSASVIVEGKPVGFLGVLHPKLAQEFKVDCPVAMAELNLDTLFLSQPRSIKAKAAPQFPAMERDLAVVVPLDLSSAQVQSEFVKAAGPKLESCEVFDVYQGANLPPGTRSMAYRFTYRDPDKTLVEEEVNASHQKMVSQVISKLGLTIR